MVVYSWFRFVIVLCFGVYKVCVDCGCYDLLLRLRGIGVLDC